VGASRHITAEKLAKETDLKTEQIRALPNLVFYRVPGDQPTVRQRLRFIGRKFAMNPKAWAKVTRQQAKAYYRKPKPDSATIPKAQDSWAPYFL
jgi:hypothetical protein